MGMHSFSIPYISIPYIFINRLIAIIRITARTIALKVFCETLLLRTFPRQDLLKASLLSPGLSVIRLLIYFISRHLFRAFFNYLILFLGWDRTKSPVLWPIYP